MSDQNFSHYITDPLYMVGWNKQINEKLFIYIVNINNPVFSLGVQGDIFHPNNPVK